MLICDEACITRYAGFIWYLEGDERLPEHIKQLIEDSSNNIQVHIVSFWEIAIKRSLGKLLLSQSTINLIQECIRQHISILPLSPDELISVESLPFHHRDPFDRLIISAAIGNGLLLVSSDDQFDNYPVTRIY